MPFYGSTLVKVDSLTATAVLAVGHACNLLAIRGHMSATNQADCFIQLFDKATAAEVTVGTTKPDWVIEIPANVNGSVSAGDGVPSSAGLKFDNGIVLAATGQPNSSSLGSQTVFARLAVM